MLLLERASHTYTTTTEDPTLTPGERQVSNTYTMTHHQVGEPNTYTSAKWDILLSPYFAYYFSVEFRMALLAPWRATRQRKQRFSHSGQSEANLHHYGGIHLWLSRLFAGAPLMETNFHLHSAHTACEIQLDSGSNFYTSPYLFNVGVHLIMLKAFKANFLKVIVGL